MRCIYLIVLHSAIVAIGVESDRDIPLKNFIVATPSCSIRQTNISYAYTNLKIPNNDNRIPLSRMLARRPVRQVGNYKFWIDTVYAKCCYRHLYPITRPNIEHPAKDIDLFHLDHKCRSVKESVITVTADRVRFECVINISGGFYNEHYMFANINKTVTTSKVAIQNDSHKKKISILILGLDSTSRMSFHRFMPKTNYMLRQLHAAEFFGFNRIGNSSFPNLFGLLIKGNHSLYKNLSCIWDGYFDQCPLIWKPFSKANYVTGFAEDETRAGLFTFSGKKGFYNPSVDYDYRIADYFNAKDTYERNRMLFQFTRLFTITIFRDTPYFFYAWSTGITHDLWDGALIADDYFYKLFVDLNKSRSLDNTAVFFLSDHGYRGRMPFDSYERDLPFLFVILPRWFRNKYPIAWQNFRDNRYRLTTVRDVQTTILDLLHLDNLKKDNSEKPFNEFKTSFFDRISERRNCQIAGIPKAYCSCVHN